MKITEDVHKYAAENGMTDAEARKAGMDEKSKEFVEAGCNLQTDVSSQLSKSQFIH